MRSSIDLVCRQRRTWRSTRLAVFALGVCAVCSGQEVSPSLDISCDRLGAAYISIPPADVLASRVPWLGALHVPQSCFEVAQHLHDQFVSEDESSMPTLIMRACSARLGWVEKIPGTCQAGGPPPICPADHWKRDPNSSMVGWDQLNRQKLEDRTNQIRQGACSCWKGEIEAATRAAATPIALPSLNAAYTLPSYHAGESQSVQTSGSDTLVVPCSSDNECNVLPGNFCVQGICRGFNQRSANVSDLTEQSVNQLADDYSKSIPGGSLISFLKDAVAPLTIGTWMNMFQKNALALDLTVTQIERDYRLLVQSKSSVPSYSGPPLMTLVNELDDLETQANGEIAAMKDATSGIRVERELGVFGCDEVFDGVSSSMIRAAEGLINARPKS